MRIIKKYWYFFFLHRIKGSASGLSKRQVAATVREAFDLFTPHVPLTFTSVAKGDPSDIEINFRSQNKDPQMDGAGKSVGRAYPPLAGANNLGKIYLDAAEDFTVGEARGKFFNLVSQCFCTCAVNLQVLTLVCLVHVDNLYTYG